LTIFSNHFIALDIIHNPHLKKIIMVLEAGYPNTTGFRKVVKATILVKKKPGLSDEDFISHYNTKHAEMAKGVLLKHGCITYSLVSTYSAIYTP
jgi:hypothetical protein